MITVNVQCFNTFGGILIFSTNHCRCLYLHAWHQAIYIWCDGSYIPQSMTFTVVVSVLGLGMKWVSVLHLLSLFVLNFPAISWCISDFSISTVSMWFFHCRILIYEHFSVAFIYDVIETCFKLASCWGWHYYHFMSSLETHG